VAKNWWQRKAQKLGPRHWDELVDAWLSFVPRIDVPGNLPESALRDLVSLRDELAQVDGDHPRDIPGDVPGLRPGMLREGLCQLHKAANVLCGAQVHIAEGFRSWSISSSYQAAFFAMKAILNLLGISYVEDPERGNFIVDIWSDPATRRRRPKVTPTYEIRLLKTHRIEHRQAWAIFQKVLAKTHVAPTILTPANHQAFVGLDMGDFARERNALHYRIAWPFDDLHTFTTDMDYGCFGEDLTDGTVLGDPEDKAFSVALGFVLVRTGYQMLSLVAAKSSVIREEVAILDAVLASEKSNLYQNAYSLTGP